MLCCCVVVAGMMKHLRIGSAMQFPGFRHGGAIWLTAGANFACAVHPVSFVVSSWIRDGWSIDVSF